MKETVNRKHAGRPQKDPALCHVRKTSQRWTPGEEAEISEAAEARRLKVGTFVREAALAVARGKSDSPRRGRPTATVALPQDAIILKDRLGELRAQIGRGCSNLMRLMRAAETGGQLDGADLRMAVRDLYVVMRELNDRATYIEAALR